MLLSFSPFMSQVIGFSEQIRSIIVFSRQIYTFFGVCFWGWNSKFHTCETNIIKLHPQHTNTVLYVILEGHELLYFLPCCNSICESKVMFHLFRLSVAHSLENRYAVCFLSSLLQPWGLRSDRDAGFLFCAYDFTKNII